jgi:hypothetical protein
LDYFGLRSLNDLPTLAELRDPDFLGGELELLGGGPMDDASGELRIPLADPPGSEVLRSVPEPGEQSAKAEPGADGDFDDKT